MRTDAHKPPPEEKDWYRDPTPRERKIGAWLFIGFGLFFVALFFVERGWGFRWVILALAAVSLGSGSLHLIRARKEP